MVIGVLGMRPRTFAKAALVTLAAAIALIATLVLSGSLDAVAAAVGAGVGAAVLAVFVGAVYWGWWSFSWLPYGKYWEREERPRH